MEKQAKAAQPVADDAMDPSVLASFLQAQERFRLEDAEFDAMYPEEPLRPPSRPAKRFEPTYSPPSHGVFDVPIAIGRAR
jgi:hypothetical protein